MISFFILVVHCFKPLIIRALCKSKLNCKFDSYKNLTYTTVDPYRVISIVVGILYILGFVAGILSIAPAIDNSDYLANSSLSSNQINRAAYFQFLMAFIYIGVAILLFPILKIYNERLAIGFLSFRIIAVLFVLIGTIILLLILRLSHEYIKISPSDSSYYQMIGKLLKTARDLVNHVGMIIMLCVSGIMLYTIIIQSGLIPLWISIWGLLASSLAIITSILVLIKYVEVLTPTYMILNIPIVLQEIVFAIWLIVKGFKQL
jgi:hypothetical protein